MDSMTSPESQSAVWPPPPTAPIPSPAFSFKENFLRAGRSTPRLRTGIVRVEPTGLLIEGKTVLPYEQQVPILISCLLVQFVIPVPFFLIAYFVMEYALRKPETLRVSWNDVSQIVLASRKRRVSIAFNAPNYKGVTKTFSLDFGSGLSQWETLTATLRQYAPNLVGEGKLRAWTSPAVWIFVSGILLTVIVLLALAAFGTTVKPHA